VIGIGFGASDSWRSRLIRWATAAKWSHVWIEYPSTCWGGMWVAHATELGVIKEPSERVHKRFDRFCVFDVRWEDMATGMVMSRDLIGRPYDFKVVWNALLLVLNRVFRWKWLGRVVFKDITRVTCSEFVATVMQKGGRIQELHEAEFITLVMQRVGLEQAKEVNPEFVTPGDLFKLCRASRAFWTLPHGGGGGDAE